MIGVWDPDSRYSAEDLFEVRDSTFQGLASDVFLVEGNPHFAASGVSFEDVPGEPMIRQRCDRPGPGAWQLDAPAPFDVDCGPVQRETRPLPTFDSRLLERDIVP